MGNHKKTQIRFYFLIGLVILLLVVLIRSGDQETKIRTLDKRQEDMERRIKEELDSNFDRLEQDILKLKKAKVLSTTKPTVAASQPQPKPAVVIPVGKEKIAKYIRSKFGSEYAVRIAQCESGLNQNATGTHGERGIFQIHPVHAYSMTKHGFTWASMYEWKANIDYAYLLYTWQGWNPWTCRYSI